MLSRNVVVTENSTTKVGNVTLCSDFCKVQQDHHTQENGNLHLRKYFTCALQASVTPR